MGVMDVLKQYARLSSNVFDSGIAAELKSGLTPMPFQRLQFLEDHIFIHVHIAKTGGTALTRGLAGIVGEAHTIDTRGRPQEHRVKNLSQRSRKHIKLYCGHIHYGAHRNFKQTPLYVASMRDPVSRFVSYYGYALTSPNHPAHSRFQGLNLEAAFEVERERDAGSANNGQSRSLSDDRIKSLLSSKAVMSHVKDKYLFVIPNKKIDHALRALQRVFDLPHHKAQRVNVGSWPKPEVSGELKRRITEANSIDAEVEAWVRDRYDQALEQACDRLADGMRRYG